MKASANARRIKEYFEGREYKAYPDPGSKDGKPWTIGIGHTGAEVVEGLVLKKIVSGLKKSQMTRSK